MGGVLKDTVVESPIKRTVKGEAKCVYFLKEVRYMGFFRIDFTITALKNMARYIGFPLYFSFLQW